MVTLVDTSDLTSGQEDTVNRDSDMASSRSDDLLKDRMRVNSCPEEDFIDVTDERLRLTVVSDVRDEILLVLLGTRKAGSTNPFLQYKKLCFEICVMDYPSRFFI